jgi:hypothetical protein
MSEPTPKMTRDENARRDIVDRPSGEQKPDWETPQMQDVSEEVMAQPYIRFT